MIAATSRIIPLPDDMSLEKAASMPVTYITAHHMLHHLGNLKSTDTVLIHGGAGGVGTAALQLCQWAGVSKVGYCFWDTRVTSLENMVEFLSTATIKILSRLSSKQPMEKVWIISLIQ